MQHDSSIPVSLPLPAPTAPEPSRGFARPALIAGAVMSGALLVGGLTIAGQLSDGADEARLVGKVMYLLIVAGIAGILDAIRAIGGHRAAALRLGVVHLVFAAALFAFWAVMGHDAHGRQVTVLHEMQALAVALTASGGLALAALGQVTRYGAWRASRAASA